MNTPHALRRLSIIVVALAMAGCATKTPNAVYVTPLTAVVAQGDSVSTTVRTTDGRMPEMERQMLADRITQNVQAFAQPGSGTAQRYVLEVNITRYARGNGLVRTTLPGMGQIQLHGVVSVYHMPKRVKVGEFIVNKSFMMGGLYGVSVGMNTISNTFAQAVAKTVCQVR